MATVVYKPPNPLLQAGASLGSIGKGYMAQKNLMAERGQEQKKLDLYEQMNVNKQKEIETRQAKNMTDLIDSTLRLPSDQRGYNLLQLKNRYGMNDSEIQNLVTAPQRYTTQELYDRGKETVGFGVKSGNPLLVNQGFKDMGITGTTLSGEELPPSEREKLQQTSNRSERKALTDTYENRYDFAQNSAADKMFERVSPRLDEGYTELNPAMYGELSSRMRAASNTGLMDPLGRVFVPTEMKNAYDSSRELASFHKEIRNAALKNKNIPNELLADNMLLPYDGWKKDVSSGKFGDKILKMWKNKDDVKEVVGTTEEAPKQEVEQETSWISTIPKMYQDWYNQQTDKERAEEILRSKGIVK
jgi:hypothetical protein